MGKWRMPNHHQMDLIVADSSSSCASQSAPSPLGHRCLELGSLSLFQDSPHRMCCPWEILVAWDGFEENELKSLQ
jgi:hypothetical protein